MMSLERTCLFVVELTWSMGIVYGDAHLLLLSSRSSLLSSAVALVQCTNVTHRSGVASLLQLGGGRVNTARNLKFQIDIN